VLVRESFGVSNFSPLDGERAENRWWEDSLAAEGVDIDVTELVDALRSPLKETESRFPLRCSILPDVKVVVDA
jgi:hypothetical protein